ncbi:uncharacterized protein LOC119076386 [Bradysia coprophila]|uniref:uncharacterized protein LOC119073045 n=1 Tax=Bradysia coprophila TaxID=38358 RepID=UPI00187DC04D|nr:uncharacterized protein LOC119073045 [Bradysia coprophila]XP_037039002.1 uncharacterized protein LOC119076386 [Bradysia coprophila]
MSTKLWKERPPGREQIELEKMFKNQEIDPRRDSPDSVKRRNDLFKDFSAPVFANHFRKTKAKLGLSATVVNYDEGPSSIPEMGGFDVRERSRTPPEIITSESKQKEQINNIRHNSAPCWTWTYTDHDKKKDFVCVAVPAVSGKKAKFSISEDGLQITIKYEWPEVMFKANELFSKSNADGRKLLMNHPKVHSFVSYLNECGVTEKSSLQGDSIIDLPKKIQRENDSWTMEKVLVSDTKMILLEFSAFQKSLMINDADTSLDF